MMETLITVLITVCVCAQIWMAFYYRSDQYWDNRRENRFNAEFLFWTLLIVGVPYVLIILIMVVVWDIINKRLQIPFFYFYYFTDRYYKFREDGLERLNYDAENLRNTGRIDHVIFRQAVKMVNERFKYPIRVSKPE